MELFLRLTGLSDEVIRSARRSPMWAGVEAPAPSLAHDDAVMEDGRVPRDRPASIRVPVPALAGGASPPWLRAAAERTAGAVPGGTYRLLPGQSHRAEPEVAPVLTRFFAE
ncbi:hypothetical protein GCM10010129_45160 [Streptomyces fumigatiscleroticus]|nr:hypothetical protein GCM10010129_45160 [Streptomyces fumigatiscleroticus]